MRPLRRTRKRRKRRPHELRHLQAGAPPGTLELAEDARAPVIHLIACDEQHLHEQRVEDVAQLQQFVQDWPLVWINIDGLGDAAVLQEVAQQFGLHPLVLEDIANVTQRPKVDAMEDGNVFVVLRMVHLEEGFETEQVSLVIGPNYVLTFQEHQGDCFDPVRQRMRKNQGRVRKEGADYLAYAIIDAIVDFYFPAVERYGEIIEQLETQILAQPQRETVSSIHDLKHDLLAFRRTVWPLREVVSELSRPAMPQIRPSTRAYLRDCYEHIIQVLDMIETYREISTSLMDLYLSSVSNRMNEVMRVLTVFATIFIPLTFITGVYGMNFNPDASPWNMPELKWPYGYPACLVLMLVVTLSLTVFFRRRGWFGPPTVAASDRRERHNTRDPADYRPPDEEPEKD